MHVRASCGDSTKRRCQGSRVAVLPAVRGGPDFPAERLGILDVSAVKTSLMHQLLGDAADVHARPAEAPCRPRGGGLHEVENYDLASQSGRLL